jgi:hypothetical protein
MLGIKDYAAHEKHCIANADHFVACNFKGKATYERAERSTQALAEKRAREMIAARDPADIYNNKRPVLIYAVCGVHQVVAGTVRP